MQQTQYTICGLHETITSLPDSPAIESAKLQGPSTPLHDHYRDPQHKMCILSLVNTTLARCGEQLVLWINRMKCRYPCGFKIDQMAELS